MTAADLRGCAELGARLTRAAQATTSSTTLTTIALALAELAELAAGAEVVPALEDARRRLEELARHVGGVALGLATWRGGVTA